MNHATSCSFDDLFILFLIVFLTSYAFIGLRERSCRGWKRFFWWIEEWLHHAFIMGSCSLKSARRCATWYSNAWRCEQIYANSESLSLSLPPPNSLSHLASFLWGWISLNDVSSVWWLKNLSMAASLAGTNSPLQKREKMYLIAVGYYRSGDYSRSRQLVECCLEVWSSIVTAFNLFVHSINNCFMMFLLHCLSFLIIPVL